MILIKLILITTSWCLIVKTLTHEGMILEKLGRYADEQVRRGKKYFEPLIHCEWCLSSLHTAIGFMIGFGLEVLPFKWSWKLLIIYLVVSISTSFISGCLWNLAMTLLKYKEMLEVKIKYYEHLEKLSYFDLKERKEIHYKKHNQKEKNF